MVVWVSLSRIYGSVIVGWYKNATVYRKPQVVPLEAMQNRQIEDHNIYNICSNDAYLIPEENRTFSVEGFGRCDIWYGNEENTNRVLNYIENFTEEYDRRIEQINNSI